MLTKRIIPCLDVDAGRVVKGISFVELRDAGDPVEMAAFYDREGADELVFLDITASSDNRETIVDVVEQVAEQVFIPLTVGGGLRNPADVRKLLEAGADKVAFNTAAVTDPTMISMSADQFGSQCIVVAIDVRRIARPITYDVSEYTVDRKSLAIGPNSKWEVFINGGRTPTGIDALSWATYIVAQGAGELLVTSMDSDGHQEGYDIDLMSAISTDSHVPVIASGGAGNPFHMFEVLSQGNADAVLAASIFHYGTFSISEAKTYLSGMNIPIRDSRS